MEAFGSQVPHLEQRRQQNIEKNQAFLRSLFASQVAEDGAVEDNDEMQVDDIDATNDYSFVNPLQKLTEEFPQRSSVLNSLVEIIGLTQMVRKSARSDIHLSSVLLCLG